MVGELFGPSDARLGRNVGRCGRNGILRQRVSESEARDDKDAEEDTLGNGKGCREMSRKNMKYGEKIERDSSRTY